MQSAGGRKLATFGAGCFWGTEKFFRKEFPELLDTVVGYTGGKTDKPTYRQVCGGDTGHAEVLQVTYDPSKTSYRNLMQLFVRMHDPTQLNRQQGDVGTQYRSVVFYHDDDQQTVAKQVLEEANKEIWKGKIVTEVTKAGTFWPAEDYHQRYLEKNPGGYCSHSMVCSMPKKTKE